MSLIDIIVVGGFLGITLFIGFRAGRNIKTFKEYALGNRNFSDFVVFCTVAATMIGGNTTIGLIGKVYEIGITQVLAQIGTPISYVVIAFFVSGRIRNFYGCVSIGDILYKSYGTPGKVFGGFITCFYESLNVGLQFMAMGTILSVLTGLSYNLSLLISGTIIFLYTGRGGVKAVTFTDVLQFVVLIIAIPILLSVLLYKVGGCQELFRKLPHSYLTISDANLHRYMLILWTFCLPSLSPTVTQRLLLTKNKRQGFRSYMGSCCIYMVIVVIVVMIGLSAYVLHPDIKNADQALPIMMSKYLPVGIYGFVIAGLLAVLMSPADSLLNASSICLVNDLILPCIRKPLPEHKKLFLSRFISLFMGVFAILFATQCKGIFETKIIARSLWFPIIVVPLYFSLFNRKISKKGLFISVSIGFLTMFLWNIYIKPPTKIDGLFPGFFANFIAFTLFYLLGGGQRIFQPSELARMNRAYEEPTQTAFNEQEFRVKTNLLLGIFLVCVQILPMLFFSGAITKSKATLVLINGAMAILLMFGPSLRIFCEKHFIIFKHITLLFCLPLSSLYLMFFDDPSYSGFHVLTFAMSLVLIITLSEVKYREWMTFLAVLLTVCGGVAFFKLNYKLNFPDQVRWFHVLYLIGFMLMIFSLWFRSKMFTIEKENAVMEERYNLARSVSHDIMTPMMVMRFILKKFEQEGLTEREKSLLMDSVKEMSGIVDSILPGVSKRYENLSFEAINPIVENCVAQKKFLYKNLNLRYECREEVKARVDALLFARVISNLINNCIEAMDENSTGTVVISVGKDLLGNVQVTIRDNGCGIPYKKLERIFSYTEKGNKKFNLSIGLREVRDIMWSWHGRIDLVSTEGQGTVVTLLLPSNTHFQLIEEETESGKIANTTQESLAGKSNLYNPQMATHFILVDSSLDYQQSCKSAAAVAGVELKTYSTPDALLNELDGIRKDTCFFIEYLPQSKFSGIELARTLFEKGYSNLVIVSNFLPDVPQLPFIKRVMSKNLPIFTR